MNIPRLYRSQFDALVRLTRQKDLRDGGVLHARILKSGSAACTPIANGLINLYAKCGRLKKAHLVFDALPQRDLVSWNCLINGYSQLEVGGAHSAMGLFRRMRAENELPNAHTFAGVLTASSNSADPFCGRQAHALAIKTASFHDIFVGSSLLNMYCKAGLVVDARKAFDRMPERNSVSWATMISGYASQHLAAEALELFGSMRREEEEAQNEFVFTSVLSSFAAPGLINTGKQIHCLVTKKGLLSFVSVWNALVTMYSKCGSLEDSLRVFEFSSVKNSITWSAMVTGFAQSGESRKSLKLFSKMHLSGIEPTEFTLVGVINACSDISAIREGQQLHGYALKLGLEPQIFVITALVDMYAKCGSISEARKGFEHLREPDMVLWTSMIGGYVQNGENEDALYLYCQMQMEGILPNELTMVSVLKACSSLAALEQGKQIHASIVKHGFGLEVPIGSALSTMYAKCGDLEDGTEVFKRMSGRDVVSWNAMMSGLAQNGLGDRSLDLFDEMVQESTRPDGVTFVNILSACSHMGLVDRGRDYFNMMSEKFGLTPGVEHYACMVDLLSRAGRLDEAKDFIESAKVDHGLCLWRILLGACKNHRNYELGVYAGEKLMELGSQESSAYVLLSSIYVALGRREDVERVRSLMRARGAGKEPGCSWIDLKSGVHVFVVGDEVHPQIQEIRSELRILSKQMEDEGYKSVISDSSDDEDLVDEFILY
ncbi:pentatricopeptide repeat-containing protein At2g33680 [Punica granatum]|uniref:Uncharacterized protein n=2 Tax=Punica granatum TaxID=22663 RepID=A0A218WCP4_PUNGR|nr:pentatricopeptide repeat-containing protein At2g33680 [Punica granatum]OWM70624.1 hypothetical protein CDL15_Pgr014297 [Punica granatum]PKI55167.1 hypothetical protein CRG98_024458 [Punica granatum]